MKDKIFGLQKNVFFLGITSFLNDLSSEMVLSVLPAFFISVLKTGAGALGVVEGVADAAANLIKIYSGKRSDTLAKRKVFAVFGYSLSVFTRPFYIFAGSVFDIAALRVIDRVGKGVRDSPRDALISLSVSKDEVGWSFGYHRALDTMGGFIGPLVAYLVLSAYPGAFESVFMLSFVIGLLAVGSLMWVKDVDGLVSHGGFSITKNSVLPKRLRHYLFAVFLLAMGTLPVAVMLFKTQELGFSIASIPLFYMVYNISFSFMSWPAGRIADKVGSGRVIVFGYLALVLCYTFLVASTNAASLIAGFVILGIFSACTDGVQRSYVSKLVGPDHRGLAYGYMNAALGFGALIAGVVGGFLWEAWGSAAALSLGTAVILVGLIVLMTTLRAHHRESR